MSAEEDPRKESHSDGGREGNPPLVSANHRQQWNPQYSGFQNNQVQQYYATHNQHFHVNDNYQVVPQQYAMIYNQQPSLNSAQNSRPNPRQHDHFRPVDNRQEAYGLGGNNAYRVPAHQPPAYRVPVHQPPAPSFGWFPPSREIPSHQSDDMSTSNLKTPFEDKTMREEVTTSNTPDVGVTDIMPSDWKNPAQDSEYVSIIICPKTL